MADLIEGKLTGTSTLEAKKVTVTATRVPGGMDPNTTLPYRNYAASARGRAEAPFHFLSTQCKLDWETLSLSWQKVPLPRRYAELLRVGGRRERTPQNHIGET